MAKTNWLKKFSDDCGRIRETMYDEGVLKKMKKHINEELIDLIEESIKELAKDNEKLHRRVAAIESSLKKIEAEGVKPSRGIIGAETGSNQSNEFNRLLRASVISLDSQTVVVVPAVGNQPRNTGYLKAKKQKPKIKYQSTTA